MATTIVMALLTTVLLSLVLSLCVTTITLIHHSTTIHLIAATMESRLEVKELPTERVLRSNGYE